MIAKKISSIHMADTIKFFLFTNSPASPTVKSQIMITDVSREDKLMISLVSVK